MNEWIRLLIECLKNETGHYQNLFLLADKQRQLLVGGDTKALPENLRLEEKEVFALGPIIANRNELLKKIASSYQVADLSLAEALKKCPMEQVEEFKGAILELVRSAKKLEEMNQRNEKLLGNALSEVNFTLKLIRGKGKPKNYSTLQAKEENKASFVNRVI